PHRSGRRVPVEYDGSFSGDGALRRCRCDCGGERLVRAAHLRQNRVSHCGCLSRGRPPGSRYPHLHKIPNPGAEIMREQVKAGFAVARAKRQPRGSAPDIDAAIREFEASGRKITKVPSAIAEGAINLDRSSDYLVSIGG